MTDDWSDHVETGGLVAGVLAVVGVGVLALAILGHETAVGLWGTTAAVPAGFVGLFGLGVLFVVTVCVSVAAVLYALGAAANMGGPRLKQWYNHLSGDDDP